MNPANLPVADLDEDRLARLRSLEQDLGAVVIAYRPDSPYAPLSDEQLRRLQQLERELGVVLLAYRPQVAAAGA
jgi:hypothetical protein